MTKELLEVRIARVAIKLQKVIVNYMKTKVNNKSVKNVDFYHARKDHLESARNRLDVLDVKTEEEFVATEAKIAKAHDTLISL